MKAFRIRKIATVVFVLFAVLISLVFVLDSAAAEAENDVAVGSKGEIDVWLIAGQSNAVGFGSDGLSAQYLEDKRYTEGFDNVLFWGKYESTYNPEAFVPVTVGLGKQSATNTTTVGAEIGMAAALDGNGRMNAIIKRAVGGSYLYPTTYSTVSQNSGTWTSPSYLEKYSIDTEGNKLGNLYTEFIQTTKDGIDMLVADGYTPVIKGIWYMQGEAETPTQLYADAYAELLTMLIGDMREDLGEIVNKDLSNLPFVMGKITRNPEYDIPEFIDTVTAAQLSVASAVANAYIVDTTGMPQIDGWHYTADSQHEIGVQFINTVINSSGKYSVTASGTGVSLSGGGAKSVGDEVTVTFTSLEGYELSSVSMKVGAGEAVDITGALVQDTENLSVYSYTFVMPTGNVAFEINATDLNAESTEYGLIPSMFTDAEKYPFILFKSGEFVYAFDDWCDFVNSNSIAGCTLLLRRNYDTTESSGSPWALCHSDELTIDLGKHIFTRGMYHMFQCLGRDEKVYTSTITVKNGTLKSTFSYVNASGTTTGASPLVVFNNSASSTTVDKFNFIFDGVIFDVSSGRGIVASFTDGTCGTDNTITLNNCTIYRGASTSAMTLFALAETSGNKNDIKVTINGGKLVADTLSKLTFATYDVEREAGEGSPDSLTLNTDSSGNKFTVELPLSAGTPTQMFTFTKGGYAAVKLSDDGTTAKYTLEYLGTPYGNIDVKYASAADYPFVLFKNGAVLTAFSNWKTFIDSTMYNSADYKTGCTLLLRRDYSTSEASGNPWALSYIKDIVIDLGRNVFTRGNNHMFQAYGHGNAAGNTSIKVINGTLKAKFYKDNGTTSATPLIVFNNSADSTADDAFAFTFEGVTFDVSEGRGIVACYTDGTYGTKNTMILNNCTIYRGTSTSSMTLFALTESSGNKNDVNIIINGGKFVANSFSKLTLATFSAERESGKGSPDSLKFGAYNGKYVSFVTKSGNAAPTYDFVTVNGSQVSFADVSTSENAIYQLGEDIKTDYGYIPYAYSNTDNCPVIIFKNGTYYGNNTVFSAAYSTAVGQTGDSANTVVTVLLRKSLTEKLSASLTNADTIKGTLIVDLGGNTYETSAKALFQFNAKNSTNNPKIEFRNGRINSIRLIAFANQTTAKCQNYDILFKNVTLGFTRGTWNDMVSTNKTAASDGYYAHANLTFEDCIFDLRANQTFTSYRLLDLANDTNNHAVDVIFRGGEFLLDDYAFTLASIKSGYSDNTNAPEGANDSDTVKFEKGANGYTVFRLPSGATAPTNVYDSTELTFVKVSDDGTEATYNLMPAAAVNLDFKPKMSITLGSELVYNIYVPVADYLKSFTVDGNIVECKEIFTLDDENSYYRIEVSLPAKEAARNIILKATVTVDGKDYTGSWTMSIPKYAAALLETSASEEEKTLVKDVLQYIRAAYTYFGSEDAEQMAKINTLLGDYASKPTVEGSDVADTTGMKSATLVLSGKPSIRFYLADGANASAYKFYIGGKQIKTVVSDDGTYVDIDVYAYALCETVTYTIDGEAAGSFHINAYYAFVSGMGENSYTGADKEALTALTECFWKYLQSARAYRESVVEN